MLRLLRRVSCWPLFTATLAFGWTSGELAVEVTESPMNIRVSAGATTLAEITAFTFGTVKYTTVSSVSSTDDALTITLSSNTSITVTGVEGGINFKSTSPSVATVMITLKDQGEHFFGITEHNIANNPDLRGKSNILDKITAYQRSDEDAEVYSGFISPHSDMPDFSTASLTALTRSAWRAQPQSPTTRQPSTGIFSTDPRSQRFTVPISR